MLFFEVYSDSVLIDKKKVQPVSNRLLVNMLLDNSAFENSVFSVKTFYDCYFHDGIIIIIINLP